MREIKFRAWHKKHQTMIYAPLACVGDDTVTEDHIQIIFSSGGSYCDVYFKHDARENVELMQFTGLLDKNGKEIYESDIVRVHDRIAKSEIDCVIKWEDVGKASEFSRWFADPIDMMKEEFTKFWHYQNIEVIGNIYETPELVKK